MSRKLAPRFVYAKKKADADLPGTSPCALCRRPGVTRVMYKGAILCDECNKTQNSGLALRLAAGFVAKVLGL